MRKSKFLFVLTALLTATTSFAQGQKFTGKVLDDNGQPVIGATVKAQGSSLGTITDLDGQFTISANPGQELVISYIGYDNKTIKAANNMQIVLTENTKSLEELVVVGYGVQKKSVVTASIAKVSASDLAETAPVRMDNALKGLAAGVNVTSSSGQPGAAAKIRVRGTGTINNSDPLYIVDGMPIEGGLDYLNPCDIESIEVLKDAASGAVYGARAANGVILVTTKQGQKGKPKVSYDFSYGWQSKWRKRDVTNATEYAILRNEAYVNAGDAPVFSDPYSYGKGTDWQDLIFNDNAPVVDHEVSISGANDRLKYLLSMGYFTQEGIVGGNYGRSNYERLTLRSNNTYNVFNETSQRNWLNKMDLFINLSYARVKSTGIETNSTWGSPLGSALMLSPILTPYVEGEEAIAQNEFYKDTPGYEPSFDPNNGKQFRLPGSGYQEMTNPLQNLSLPGSKGWSHKFVANFAGELQLIDNLKFRTSYGVDLSFWGSDGYTPTYYMRSGGSSTFSSVSSESDRGTVWQVENVLSYNKDINEHSFSVILGQSAKESSSYYLGGSANYLVTYKQPYLDATTGQAADGDRNSWGAPNPKSRLASLFGRVSYNYDERYMFQGTLRRDGSSRFGSNRHWATFPSFSLGWNVTNEPYMKNKPSWLSNTKVRLSWGKNGNENMGNFMYTVLTSKGNNYIFGNGSTVTNGVKASGLANPDLEWEESVQTDLGVDFGFFGNALTFTVDYYKKTTNGMLLQMPIPSYVGESKPWGNVGKMENSGVEFELSYKFRKGELSGMIKGNASYLKNKLINYGNETGFENYDSFQGVGTITRAQNGEPFPYFYGYKTAGVFQNQAQIDAWNVKPLNGATLQPGDVIFVDVDKDGAITENDRTNIGKGTPDWTFGASLNLEYKGFDFYMFWQGTAGNDVFDATRRVDAFAVNYPSYMLNRWTGEGTSNKYPRMVRGDAVNWGVSSDLYVYDGSYMRLKNMQIGYTLPQEITSKFFLQRLRFYVAAENLLTLTKYHGFDPEISSGGTSLGVDYGVYPQARVFTVGVNVDF